MEENTGTPAVEHVSLGENGAIMLSEEAMAVMEGIETPQLDEPVVPPAPESQAETIKIKHNGKEVEVPKEKELELLQKGFDYDYKREQIDRERAQLQAYQGLVNAIEASPEIKRKVAEALGYQQPQPHVETVPQFDDPIEQLKWETRQEVLREVEEKYAKPFQQQMQMQTHQQQLNMVRQQVQADPMFQDVQAEMIRQIQSMPESIGRNLYLQLDQDPRSYLDMFQTTKQRLSANKQQPSTQQAAIPEPVKRETKAPILEQGNNAETVSSDQQKLQDRIKDLSRRSKNGDYRATGELMNLLA